jgi:hypothetical protein
MQAPQNTRDRDLAHFEWDKESYVLGPEMAFKHRQIAERGIPRGMTQQGLVRQHSLTPLPKPFHGGNLFGNIRAPPSASSTRMFYCLFKTSFFHTLLLHT